MVSEDSAHTKSSLPLTGSVAVILGSAFSANPPRELSLHPLKIATPWGDVTIFEALDVRSDLRTYLVFRHGLPHRTLPHLVNYKAYAFALKTLECKALLITSSVGVLDRETPLDHPLLVSDLLMPDQRLPSGEVCTMFDGRSEGHSLESTWTKNIGDALKPGHLVLKEGLCSSLVSRQVAQLIREVSPLPDSSAPLKIPEVVFAYVPGPRTKTPAENRYWSQLGAQVNSMSLGPELVLANELEIPCAALVIGHKRSGMGSNESLLPQFQRCEREKRETKNSRASSLSDQREMAETLKRSHDLLESIIVRFLSMAEPVEYQNYLYRFPTPSKN